jgi:pimeloyl-ACP methyl ester carboxylesterase
MSATPEATLALEGGHIEVVDLPGDPKAAPTVLLHEGLGSVGLWRGFPRALAGATGCRTVAFSRYGHGQSDPPPRHRTPRFMHEEALEVLPDVLALLGLRRPVLVGHSDGASIALIHAASHRVRGVVAMTPHVFVEECCLKEIRRVRSEYLEGPLRERMARHHRNPDSAFHGWSDVWLHPDFRAWDIRELLPRIDCPVLVIQGERDQYGTMAQLDAIEGTTAGSVERLHLDCQHAPHLERPQATLGAIAEFITRI